VTALGMVLKSIGVNITDEHRQQIETMLPQLPAKVVQIVGAINASIDTINRNSAELAELRGAQEALREEMRKEFNLLMEELHGRSHSNPERTGSFTNGVADDDTTSTSGRYLAGNPSRKRLK
jgi:septal ring factor EnvC (AmiA/AmiB activator)